MKRFIGFSPSVIASPPDGARETIFARVGDGEARIEVRRATRARRMTLRVPPGNADPIVTIPLRAPLATVERFIRTQEGWLSARLSERAPAVPFADGATVPLRGVLHLVRATGTIRGTVRVEDEGDRPVILAPGAPEHIARRVTTWMRAEARADLECAVEGFAARVDRTVTSLRIKDTRAQWGSCSPSGVLSFSWRLVLAPPFVLRYVAAHEVAHLVELNHSAAFWAVNAALDPHHEKARAWLKRHGRTLHAIGSGH